MTSKYSYQPLQENEIRLVRLYGPEIERQDDKDTLPTVEILHESLGSDAIYEALSYTWGTATTLHPIPTIHDTYIEVSEGLHKALKLIKPPNGSKYRDVWIDQLCINQADTAERSQQVRRMREIYATATQVLVYLGDVTGPELASSIVGNSTIDPLSPECRKILAGIIDQPVFRRAWVYQEIVSSKNVTLVGHGIKIGWNALGGYIKQAIKFERRHGVERTVTASPGFKALDLIFNDREQIQEYGGKDWMQLLVQAQGIVKCTDLRDHVIALSTFQDFYPQTANVYTFSVPYGYWAAAKAMIAVSKSLDVFAAVSGKPHEPHLHGMPSWVPDWGRDTGMRPLVWPSTRRRSFNAAKGYKHKPSNSISVESLWLEYDRELTVFGRRIDRPKTFCSCPFEDEANEPDVRKFLQIPWHYKNYMDHMKRQEVALWVEDEENAYLALLATMTASLAPSHPETGDFLGGEIPDCIFRDMYDMCANYDAIVENRYAGKPTRTFSDALIPGLNQMFGGWLPALSKFREWASICNGRRVVFGTEKAVGLVPKETKSGDEIFILHGSKVPVVLRKNDDKDGYELVGQCYWYGWMYGDKVNWKEEDADMITLV